MKFLVFATVLLMASYAEAAKIAVGQTCKLTAEIQIDQRRRDGNAKVTLTAGELVRVLALWQGEYRVVSHDKRGWVAESVLDALCEISPKIPRL